MTVQIRTRHAQARTPVVDEISDLRMAFDPSGHSWMDEGRCVRFVAMGGRALWTSDEPRDLARAEELCLDCTVFSQCQAYAEEQRGKVCGVLAGVNHPFKYREAHGATNVRSSSIRTPRSRGDGEAVREAADVPTADRQDHGVRPLHGPQGSRSSRDTASGAGGRTAASDTGSRRGRTPSSRRSPEVRTVRTPDAAAAERGRRVLAAKHAERLASEAEAVRRALETP